MRSRSPARHACQALLVTHAGAPRFYARHGFEPLETWRRARLPARAGGTQYAAEPFEPAQVAGVLQQERQLTGELAERGTELLLAQIGRMSPEDRAVYAQALLEDKGPRGRRRRD